MTDNLMGPDLHHIDSNESVPVFLMHGLIDSVVSPNKASIASCSVVDSNYYWHGSISIAKKLCAARIPYDLILGDSIDHNVAASGPVNNIVSYSMLDFIRRRGLCPVAAPSYVRTYSFSGDLTGADTCIPPAVVRDTSTSFANYKYSSALVRIYPNPASDRIFMKLELPEALDITIQFQDITGREVYQRALGKLNSGLHTIQIETGAYLPGLYFYKLQINNVLVQGKLQIIR